MLKDIKNTLSQSAVYGLSRVATKLVSFILIPLYTSVYASDAIANINLLESFWQYLFTVCMFGFEVAIVNFWGSASDESRKKKIIFSFFSMMVFNAAVFIAAGFFIPESISEFILKERGLDNAVSYCFFISAFETLLILPMTIARINSKPVLYTVITVSSLLINLILQLLFILKFSFNFEYIFLAKLIAPAFVFIVFVPYVLKNLEVNFDSHEIREILKFSFPMMLAMLTSILLNSVDRFILTEYVSKTDVAVYTTGYSVGSVTNAFVITPFYLAIQIIFWKKINDDNFRRFMTKTSTYLFFVMILISLIITLAIPYAIKIFVRNPELWSSMEIVPFILFANCFVALFIFPSLDFYFLKQTKYIFIISLICLLFKVLANIAFIKYGGIFASALVTILAYILMMALGFHFTKKESFTKYEFYKLSLLSVLFIIMAPVFFIIETGISLVDISLKIILLILFFIILYVTKFFEPVEIESMKKIFNKYILNKA
ncbi:MAG: hypothetical protein HGGPFJEG_00187 [Ignavibacteria bacterium]|nr:hypothetical protein [Ignavibacteria bacterium]